MSRCRVAIIADDLTGALDAAAPFAARGATTRVVIALEQLEAALEAWKDALPEVIAVNTESRHLAPGPAAARVAWAARCLARAAPERWFKKIDSTLRGQVVAETLALRKATGRRLLVAPAVPAQGRTVCNAEVHVEGVPLAATAYGQDARSAPPLGPLDTLYAVEGVSLSRHRPLSEGPLPTDDCVCDAVNQADLSYAYRIMVGEPSRWLAVGAAGLATVMAQHLFGRLRGLKVSLSRCQHRLYAVGSRSPRAAAQLALLRASAPELPVCQALSPQATAPDRMEAGILVPGPGTGEETAEAVAVAMGEQVARVVALWPEGAGLLLLTGGDIAMAALQRLGVVSIEVMAEWAPGVPLGRLDGDPNRLVITKAGGFGEPELLGALERVLPAAGLAPGRYDQS
ncbi:four-carbon acid sugar kinase family protein [Halomonas sp. JS92-SW72]|uniref:four-carbon acid sugar kinase family protein n=1 Tax=Halomonas sp. JS92-SW72 TaxID=2306583 RepID=UPI000E5A24E8|nr:four-carbon acid sugar kinase family protein [Halomonas sp. JS92-SW72]AXY41572.1 four-carbon acid sugar kinase family protein [Halomonas sp. JS92-SW72]